MKSDQRGGVTLVVLKLKAFRDGGREDSLPTSAEDRIPVRVLVLDQRRQQCPHQADIPSVSPSHDRHHGPSTSRVRLPRADADRIERGADPVRLSAVLSSHHGAPGYRETLCLALRARQYSQGTTLLCSYRYG